MANPQEEDAEAVCNAVSAVGNVLSLLLYDRGKTAVRIGLLLTACEDAWRKTDDYLLAAANDGLGSRQSDSFVDECSGREAEGESRPEDSAFRRYFGGGDDLGELGESVAEWRSDSLLPDQSVFWQQALEVLFPLIEGYTEAAATLKKRLGSQQFDTLAADPVLARDVLIHLHYHLRRAVALVAQTVVLVVGYREGDLEEGDVTEWSQDALRWAQRFAPTCTESLNKLTMRLAMSVPYGPRASDVGGTTVSTAAKAVKPVLAEPLPGRALILAPKAEP
ncbi:MAG: hypothetical protein V4671_20320 [Armatimonadota bacterium]